MPVTIAIPPTIEQRLRDYAARQGVSLEDYIAQMLISEFSGSNRQDVANLPEDQLLQRVQLEVYPLELEEYYRLIELGKRECLTEAEQARRIELTHRVEIAHAERMKYVAAPARLRGISLEEMMMELGMQKNAA
jgi:hypothetical protein